MRQSISHELLRILTAMKASGKRVVWLSEANRDILRNSQAGARLRAGSQGATMSRGAMATDTPARPMSGAGQNRMATPAAPAPPETRGAAEPARNAPPAFAPSQSPPHPAADLPSLPTLPPLDLSAADWSALEGLCATCERCELSRTRHRVVFGQGQRQARVMFIGEGPGYDEDMQGLPFVGAAGQLLTKMIAAMGLDRYSEDAAKGVYIANIVKCRPQRNRNPEQGEADACLPYLRRQIELVKPEAIILLGAVPLQYLLGITGITKNRGQWLSYGDIPVMPTFHPAYILRFSNSPQLERENKLKVWDDLKKVMALLNLPLPPPRRQ